MNPYPKTGIPLSTNSRLLVEMNCRASGTIDPESKSYKKLTRFSGPARLQNQTDNGDADPDRDEPVNTDMQLIFY